MTPSLCRACAYDVLALRSDLHRQAQRSREKQGQNWDLKQFKIMYKCSDVSEDVHINCIV